jgi:hypothetical protein
MLQSTEQLNYQAANQKAQAHTPAKQASPTKSTILINPRLPLRRP